MAKTQKKLLANTWRMCQKILFSAAMIHVSSRICENSEMV